MSVRLVECPREPKGGCLFSGCGYSRNVVVAISFVCVCAVVVIGIDCETIDCDDRYNDEIAL